MSDLRTGLRSTFRWQSDPPDDWREARSYYADDSSWYRSPDILTAVGPALAALFPDNAATAVAGPESRGMLLGPLVAHHLGIGFIEVRKEAQRASHTDRWYTRSTTPDYLDRTLELAVRRSTLRSTDRILFVDDWAATGGQASATMAIVADAGATWLGAGVIVDGLQNAADRRRLNLRGLLHVRELDRRD